MYFGNGLIPRKCRARNGARAKVCRNGAIRKRKTEKLQKSRGENLVFSLRREEFLQLRGEGGRLCDFVVFWHANANTSHRDTLPIVGGRELRLGRLYRVQCGCKLIGPKLLAVSHLAVALRFLRGRSTRRPQALRQQLDQIRRMRLISQYQHACGHQSVRQQGTYSIKPRTRT